MNYILRQPHWVSFNGKHNIVKAKVFLFLYDKQVSLGDTSSLTVKELAELTDTPLGSLYSLCYRWHRWHYITRRTRTDRLGNSVYTYGLAVRGKLFVSWRIPADIMQSVRDSLYSAVKESIQQQKNTSRAEWIQQKVHESMLKTRLLH